MLPFSAALDGTFKIGWYKKEKSEITNFVFKLHYRATFWLFVAFTILVTSKEFIGDNIKCLYEDGNDPDGLKVKVVETYCFITSTFTVVKHFAPDAVQTRSAAHIGVGPHTKDEEIVEHNYYQWVPYMLFFQTICFYAPYLAWKIVEDRRMSRLVKALGLFWEEGHLTKHNLDSQSLAKRLRTYGSWTYSLIGFELLNLAHLISQAFLTDLFLGGKFFSLVPDLNNRGGDDPNPLDTVFPKVTKCAFYKYGPSGDVQYRDVLCVMALNIVNEKIYVVLWYWFCFLFIASVLAVIWRLVSILLHSQSRMVDKLALTVKPPGKLKDKDIASLSRLTSYGEWVFIQYLSENLIWSIFEDFFNTLVAVRVKDKGIPPYLALPPFRDDTEEEEEKKKKEKEDDY